MSKLTVTDWANQPDAVVFGHCNPTDLAPYHQVQLLFEEMNTAAEGNVNIYVVADDVERRMMSAELGHRQSLIADAVTPNICDYAALLRQLRNPSVSKLWEQACVTIVARIDQHYSAPFALSFLELAKWAANPTSETRLRVLTVSAFEQPEASIQRALKLFCPRLTVLLVESPNQVQIARAAPRQLLLTDPDSFTEQATRLIHSQAIRQRTSIVLCHPDEAYGIIQGVLDMRRLVNRLHCNGRCVDILLSLRTEPAGPHIDPAVIFCTETSQIPMEIYNLGAIVITRHRRAALWEYGRIVNKPEQISQWEVHQAMSYKWQTSMPTNEVTILAPETSGFRRLPRRRVDNDHAIPFLVDVMANFDDEIIKDVLLCFVTRFGVLKSNMTQLEHMKCVREYSLVPGARRDLMLALLPKFEYQFLPAWFLATGITLPGATVSAKKAMVRLAAIVHRGVDFVDTKSIFWQEVTEIEKAEHLQTVAYKISGQFKMPHELMKQGGLWVALAAWHSASVSMRGFKDAASAQNVHDPIRDIANETGIIYIHTQLARQISDLVDELEDFVGISPQDKGNIPLFLDENDCEVIENVMVQTWMHRTVVIDMVRADNNEDLPRATDMVSMDTTLSKSGFDLMPLGVMMGSRGTSTKVMILAALSLERYLLPETGVLFGASVVLPGERIREWEEEGSRDFLTAIRCSFPRDADV
ncbi:hypothetical protein MAJ_05371, partial [Metarhizium majus ARSEF 297]